MNRVWMKVYYFEWILNINYLSKWILSYHLKFPGPHICESTWYLLVWTGFGNSQSLFTCNILLLLRVVPWPVSLRRHRGRHQGEVGPGDVKWLLIGVGKGDIDLLHAIRVDADRHCVSGCPLRAIRAQAPGFPERGWPGLCTQTCWPWPPLRISGYRLSHLSWLPCS